MKLHKKDAVRKAKQNPSQAKNCTADNKDKSMEAVPASTREIKASQKNKHEAGTKDELEKVANKQTRVVAQVKIRNFGGNKDKKLSKNVETGLENHREDKSSDDTIEGDKPEREEEEPEFVSMPMDNPLHLLSQIQHLLAKYIDPVQSTCFGLTCKKLWRGHETTHGIVPIMAAYCCKVDKKHCSNDNDKIWNRSQTDCNKCSTLLRLKHLLYDWHNDAGYEWDYEKQKYMRNMSESQKRMFFEKGMRYNVLTYVDVIQDKIETVDGKKVKTITQKSLVRETLPLPGSLSRLSNFGPDKKPIWDGRYDGAVTIGEVIKEKTMPVQDSSDDEAGESLKRKMKQKVSPKPCKKIKASVEDTGRGRDDSTANARRLSEAKGRKGDARVSRNGEERAGERSMNDAAPSKNVKKVSGEQSKTNAVPKTLSNNGNKPPTNTLSQPTKAKQDTPEDVDKALAAMMNFEQEALKKHSSTKRCISGRAMLGLLRR